MSPPARDTFATRLVRWQRGHGRQDLPWQRTRDPYRVWLSEIMLQQTQVAAVIPYYARFLERFPDVAALAQAPVDEVMRLWAGLGYYSRARHLHAAARMVMDRFGGAFPRDPALLADLPGVGRSTAAAIAAFSFGERAAILDGNVKRVLARAFGIEGFPGAPAVERTLWRLAEALLPSPAVTAADADAMAAHTQGLMDLGATVCTRSRPRCPHCPFATDCVAHSQGRTSELPQARPRRALPRRATAMLLIRDGDRVMVERRPDTGIWGGLWSLPEAAAVADPSAADAASAVAHEASSRFRVRVAQVSRLATFEHVFTHYRLSVQPWVVDVAAAIDAEPTCSSLPGASPGPSSPRAWLAARDVAAAALPQPVKRLLLQLQAPRLL